MEKENHGISFEEFYRDIMEDVTAEVRRQSESEIEKANLKTGFSQKDVLNAIVDSDGGYYSEDGTRFLYLKEGVESYSVKEGTFVLCDESFKGNTKVKEIKLPYSLAKIGDEAFANCAVEKIIMRGCIVPILGHNTFNGSSPDCFVPIGNAKAFLSTDQWNNLNIIESDI